MSQSREREARLRLSGEERALNTGTLVHERLDVARFTLRGPGRVACLQGLVTCDVERTDGRLSLFGAVLTAKGMIVTPLWIYLGDDEIRIEAPQAATPALEDIFRRTLPPRQCRWENVTATTVSIGLYGPDARPVSGALPAVARGAPGFDAQLPAAAARRLIEDALAGGVTRASEVLMERCRIEAGIPRLGAEIDDRTLPQEVRLEQLGAVSYTKGCYVGQETVARVHFRGHANRKLVSVDLPAEPATLPHMLAADDKPAGRITSATFSPAAGAWIGLALIRSDVADGAALADAGSGTVFVREGRWLRPA